MTSVGTVLSFPIPLYQNVPIEPQFFQPSRFVIQNITLGFTTTVTTTTNHNYVIGQEIRLIIPSNFGCYQLNQMLGYVLSIPSTNSVVININSSRNVDSFISGTITTTSPQILATGDTNQGATNISGRINTGTLIPGSFQNISPQ